MTEYISEAMGEADYIVFAGENDDKFLRNKYYKKAFIINFNFIELIHGISPESTYFDSIMREKLENANVVLTGMSYTQRGFVEEKFQGECLCLARPSQDIFMDYQGIKWAYDEIVLRGGHQIDLCIIGMNYYRLWYDISLSESRFSMLSAYPRMKCVHHFQTDYKKLLEYDEDMDECNKIFYDDFLKIFFKDENLNVKEKYICRGKNKFIPDEKEEKESIELINKMFNKNYSSTFYENIGILKRTVKFLKSNGIRCILYIPPFPKMFCEGGAGRKKTNDFECDGGIEKFVWSRNIEFV